jgi:hypothetical protein
MQLTNPQQAELRDAILAAFPGINGVGDIDMALRSVDIDLAFEGGLFTSTKVAINNVIVRENARGKIQDVIGALRRANPGNPKLAGLEASWLKTSAAEDKSRLEAMILDTLQYRPADDWGKQLNASYRWVCRVEREADERAMGTGFLVADDLVLTNYHVMYGTMTPGSAEPTPAQLRFDAVGDAAGRVAKVAAENWIVAKSQPGTTEWGGGGNADPTPAQLDFALLRLAEPVGRDVDGGGTPRGHVLIDGASIDGQALHPVVVLQHPLGAPLQICLGAFDQPNANGTRLRHTATTQAGSSGSPCLSMDLTVVGLHNGGLGGRNTAIPLPLIASVVNENGTVIPVNTP